MSADRMLVARYGNPPMISAGGRGFSSYEADSVWRNMTRQMLIPTTPFHIHWDVFMELARHWDQDLYGPMAAWRPSDEEIARTNIFALMTHLGLASYQDLYQWSIDQPQSFWLAALKALNVRFQTPPNRILNLEKGLAWPQWLPGARMNIAESCFGADPQQKAIIWRDPGESELRQMSYGELNAYANRVANGLRQNGFQPGDALAIDMIMNVASVAIYLGIIKAGCRVVSIADSFTPEEIAVRLRIGQAVGIFTMDTIPRGQKSLPMYAKVIEADAPRAIVLPAAGNLSLPLRDGDLAWSDFLSQDSHFEAVIGSPQDVINILFSSGTTGDPKAIPWNHTTPIKSAADAHYHHDVHPGDVVAWPTNLGWMMGPWLIFATLMNQGTIALYGDAPIGRGFCQFVQDARVNILGVVPSLVKAWRLAGAIDGLDWSSIRLFSSTGECSNAQDMLYLMGRAGYRPVIEYCGGTEIGGGYLCGSLVQPAAPSFFTTPTLGMAITILDEAGNPTDDGEVYITGPSVGLSVDLLNKDHFKTYFQDTPLSANNQVLRRHGDQLERLPQGFYRAMGRADDTMNLGGIKTSSAELERTLKTVAGVEETAAIAVNPPGGGPSLLVIYAVVQSQVSDRESLKGEMQKAIKNHLNPLFKIHDLCLVGELPRTASGKVMRRVLRDQYTRNQA